MSWPLLIALAAGAYGLKALGVTLLGGVVERRLQPLVSLLPPALFAALVVVMTFGDGGGLTVDARLAGAAVASVAVWRRRSFIVVVAAAMAVTAGLRAIA